MTGTPGTSAGGAARPSRASTRAMFEISFHGPTPCYLGRPGDVIAQNASREDAEWLNEQARAYGGYIRATFCDGTDLRGSPERPGLIEHGWKAAARFL